MTGAASSGGVPGSGDTAGQREMRLRGRSFEPKQRLVMAIVNRTPDSFYDRGATWDEAAGSAPHAHANADESLPLQVPGQAPWTAGSGNRPAGAVPYTSGSPAMSSSGCTAPPDLLRYSPAARQPRSRCTRLPWTRNTWTVSQAEASEAR
jgi:hypothetical protein